MDPNFVDTDRYMLIYVQLDDNAVIGSLAASVELPSLLDRKAIQAARRRATAIAAS